MNLKVANFLTFLVSLTVLCGCVTKEYVSTGAKQNDAASSCDFARFNYDQKAFAGFHASLVKAITRSPASAKYQNFIINQVTFPLVVNNSKQTKFFQKAEDVRANYNEIFNSNTIDTIKAQKLSNIKCSLKGISYGDGVVWIGLDENKKFKIYSINHI